MGDGLAEFEGPGTIVEQGLSEQSDAEDPAGQRELVVEEFETENGMPYRIATYKVPEKQATTRVVNVGNDGKSLVAGSAPSLTAQADAPTQAVPAASTGAYSALQQGHDYSTDTLKDIREKIQIASEAGLKPGSRECIAKNVLSDPRIKIISVYGKAVMFRIAAVMVSSAGTIANDNSDTTKMMMVDLSAMTAEHQDPTVYELTCSQRLRKDVNSGYSIITMQGAKTAYHYRILTSVINVKNDMIERTRILDAKLWKTSAAGSMMSDDETFDLLKLVDWPGHGGKFLAAVDNQLQSVELTGLDGDEPEANYTPIGPDKFAIRSFAVDPTGTLLFYPTVSEGSPGYSYKNAEGAAELTSEPAPKVNYHRIMACRLRDGKFSDPFVFAEVNYDLDDLNVANVSSDSVGFLSTDVVNAQKAQADLYYTTIPFVKCANVIGCEAISTFAYPNTEALFDLTMRNDGNTYITGFTAQLMEQGSTKVEATKSVTFSAETLQESNYNPSENGKLKDVEADYALAPGKTSVYRVGLAIPAGWQGRKKVCVKAAEGEDD